MSLFGFSKCISLWGDGGDDVLVTRTYACAWLAMNRCELTLDDSLIFRRFFCEMKLLARRTVLSRTLPYWLAVAAACWILAFSYLGTANKASDEFRRWNMDNVRQL
jgi:hypothetical protein